jgi:hypothetical protein
MSLSHEVSNLIDIHAVFEQEQIIVGKGAIDQRDDGIEVNLFGNA